jgi:hypothetical protein
MQGFYFSRPRTVSQLIEYFNEERARGPVSLSANDCLEA